MSYGVRLCRFTSLDDIPVKDRAKPDVLLKFFRESGVRRVSTFEMTDKIWLAIKQLETDGHIKLVDSPYPWHKFTMSSANPTSAPEKP
jgi:hypothetical protein